MVQVTQEDCSLHTPIGTPFLSLLTYNRGGTVTDTTSNPMGFAAVRGPGHGVWSKAGNHTFKAYTIAFVTLNGVLTRTQTILQTIEVDSSDTYKVTAASVKFFAPDGTLLFTGCATATAKRFELAD